MQRFTILLMVLLLTLLAGCSTAPTPKQPEKPAAQRAADQRVSAWKALVVEGQGVTEERKLVLANDFVNRLLFVDDIDHWGQQDYWAAPLETISSGGGDCEDLAIAKYFTLRDLQVPEERLRITYVKALGLNKPHMVLSYHAAPESDPLVLDNLDPAIKPASKRRDLYPVYSFNGTSLWSAKERQMRPAGSADGLSLWQKLLARMRQASPQ
jgi:predicted transglutaminase-like cysteine proteinase